MKHYAIIIFLTIFIFNNRGVSQLNPNFGFGKQNGYYWKSLTSSAEQFYSKVDWINKQDWINQTADALKEEYLLGLYNLKTYLDENFIASCDSNCRFLYSINSPHIDGTTVDQMKKGLDEFYSNYANLTIVIPEAIAIVQMNIRGDDSESIDWQTRYFRGDKEMRSRMIEEILQRKK